MVTLESVLDVVPAISVAVALVYYGFQLRNQNKTRQAQLYAMIWDKVSNPDFLERYYEVRNYTWTDFEDYYEKYVAVQATDPKQFARSTSIGVLFEGIGVLVKRGFLDPLYVADFMSSTLFNYWEQRAEMIKRLREEWGNPRIYNQVEYLYDRLKPIVEEHHPELAT